MFVECRKSLGGLIAYLSILPNGRSSGSGLCWAGKIPPFLALWLKLVFFLGCFLEKELGMGHLGPKEGKERIVQGLLGAALC